MGGGVAIGSPFAFNFLDPPGSLARSGIRDVRFPAKTMVNRLRWGAGCETSGVRWPPWSGMFSEAIRTVSAGMLLSKRGPVDFIPDPFPQIGFTLFREMASVAPFHR
jgi:hypothetical protein